MKKQIIVVLLVAGIAARQLNAMDYNQLSDWQKERAVVLKRDIKDEGLALYSPDYIGLIEGSIEKGVERVITLSCIQDFSDTELRRLINDLENGLRHEIPEVHRQYSAKYKEKYRMTEPKGKNDCWYWQDKTVEQILTMSEEDRRKVAEKHLWYLKRNDNVPLYYKDNLEAWFSTFCAALNVAEEVKLPEIHEDKAHYLAYILLSNAQNSTLEEWLKDKDNRAGIKQFDRCLRSLTPKSNAVVLKYMNNPPVKKMRRNNTLPVENIKQAFYLQALAVASNDIKEQALRVPEIRNALCEYEKSINRSQINQAYPLIQEIQKEAKEAKKAFLQEIKNDDKWCQ